MCTHTHIHTMEYYSAIKKNKWNFTICNNMDSLRGYYDERNMLEKDKYCMLLLVCGIWKNDTNEQIEQKSNRLRDKEN